MNREELEKLAELFKKAIMENDPVLFESLWGAEASAWHNDDEIWMPKEIILRHFGATRSALPKFDWTNITRHFFDDGFVQEHIVDGRHRDGHLLRLPTAMVFMIKDGKIHRLKIYSDSAPLLALQAKSSFRHERAERMAAESTKG